MTHLAKMFKRMSHLKTESLNKMSEFEINFNQIEKNEDPIEITKFLIKNYESCLDEKHFQKFLELLKYFKKGHFVNDQSEGWGFKSDSSVSAHYNCS